MGKNQSKISEPPPLPTLPRGRRLPRGMPAAKAKDVPGTIFRLWHYFSNQKRGLFLLGFLTLLSISVGLAIPYLIGRAIDSMGGPPRVFRALPLAAGALFLSYLVDAFLRFAQDYLMAGISQRVVLRLRRALFAKLQVLPLAFFQSQTHGDIMSRLANDLDNVSSVVAQSTIQLFSSTLTIAGSFLLMLALSPILTAASMITIPFVFFVAKFVTKRTRPFFRSQQARLGELNGHIEEMISGVLVVKAFNQEEAVIERFNEINGHLRQVGIKAQVWSGFLMPFMNVVSNLGFTAVAGVGGALAVQGVVTVGVIASFLSYSRQFVRPLNEIASIFNSLQSALASAERVFEIMDEREEAHDNENAVAMAKPTGEIEFRHVFFNYVPDVEVLADVSFRVPAGSSLAIVGATGAGKTTIVNLLTRFYHLQAGQILIDGLDIRDYKQASLRKALGVVLQDTYLFSGTIEDNIRYGRLDAGFPEIERAAQLAGVAGFIRRLPLGYQTLLTESGTSLSQGQRQLIAIARALLADPAILILDEATSSVDTRTEVQIQAALAELMKERTSIIIAHRLSTIRHADQILLLEGGRVLEIGKHAQLMAQKGAYYRLYASQFAHVG